MKDILGQLRTLARLDLDCACFGAKGHWYELNPPLPEEEVALMEAKHRCRFPQEYRQFITEIGNGGAGPAYGVFPLGQQDHGHDLSNWEDGYKLIGDLSKPFPLERSWNLPHSFWEQQPDPPEGTPIEDEDRMWEAWNTRLENEYYAPRLTDGAIPICHEGCALRNWLVVTGPLAGTVWRDLRADNGGIHPFLKDDGTPMGFYDWYLDWLHSNLRKVAASHAESTFAQTYAPRIESLSDKKQMAFAAFCAQATHPNLTTYAEAIGFAGEAHVLQEVLDRWLWSQLLEQRVGFPTESHQMVDHFLSIQHELKRHLSQERKSGPDDSGMKAAIFSCIAACAFWCNDGSVRQLLAIAQRAADATTQPVEAHEELQWVLLQLENEPSEWASSRVIEALRERANSCTKFLQRKTESSQSPSVHPTAPSSWWKRLLQTRTNQ